MREYADDKVVLALQQFDKCVIWVARFCDGCSVDLKLCRFA